MTTLFSILAASGICWQTHTLPPQEKVVADAAISLFETRVGFGYACTGIVRRGPIGVAEGALAITTVAYTPWWGATGRLTPSFVRITLNEDFSLPAGELADVLCHELVSHVYGSADVWTWGNLFAAWTGEDSGVVHGLFMVREHNRIYGTAKSFAIDRAGHLIHAADDRALTHRYYTPEDRAHGLQISRFDWARILSGSYPLNAPPSQLPVGNIRDLILIK